MLLNYLKLSFRLMTRNPFFTFINISGLAIVFASFFALWDFSMNELHADQHYRDFYSCHGCVEGGKKQRGGSA